MARILVVDDEAAMRDLVTRILARDGHEVTAVGEAAQVPSMALADFDLLLLDVMMPEVDGFALCRAIREQVDAPILFLTAKVAEADIVRGLGLGADDYITKPFGAAELRARVAAHLRRDRREKKNAVEIGGVRFHLNGKTIDIDGETVALTKGEYEICEYLALHHGQIFTKEQIYEAVFGYDAEGDATVIASHIKNIRHKLSARGCAPIATVWGVGYKWQ